MLVVISFYLNVLGLLEKFYRLNNGTSFSDNFRLNSLLVTGDSVPFLSDGLGNVSGVHVG